MVPTPTDDRRDLPTVGSSRRVAPGRPHPAAADRPTVGRSRPVDGFALAYERRGAGTPVLVLRGWPGDREDFAAVAELLDADVVRPDLRGFGASDKHGGGDYSAAGQVASVLGLLDELGIEQAVVAGYDVGSRVGQALARDHADRVRALVVTPPLPGAGSRVLEPAAQREFWYQAFHQLELAEQLVDGRPDAVRAYLRHFWGHWSGPDFMSSPERLDALVSHYGGPGAFTASRRRRSSRPPSRSTCDPHHGRPRVPPRGFTIEGVVGSDDRTAAGLTPTFDQILRAVT